MRDLKGVERTKEGHDHEVVEKPIIADTHTQRTTSRTKQQMAKYDIWPIDLM